MATILAMLGLIISIASYEQDVRMFYVTIKVPVGDSIDNHNAMDSNRFNAWYNQFFKWVVFFTTIAAIICLFMRKKYKNDWINNYLLN